MLLSASHQTVAILVVAVVFDIGALYADVAIGEEETNLYVQGMFS
jgi:hypothetical protein